MEGSHMLNMQLNEDNEIEIAIIKNSSKQLIIIFVMLICKVTKFFENFGFET